MVGAGSVACGVAASSAASTVTSAVAVKKCTDQIDYAGDSRSNAEINSVGERTGHCPVPAS
jgi:hypothetical protein